MSTTAKYSWIKTHFVAGDKNYWPCLLAKLDETQTNLHIQAYVSNPPAIFSNPIIELVETNN